MLIVARVQEVVLGKFKDKSGQEQAIADVVLSTTDPLDYKPYRIWGASLAKGAAKPFQDLVGKGPAYVAVALEEYKGEKRLVLNLNTQPQLVAAVK